ncbi:unnamed protein product [Rotaria magnacalcarata]|uniref:HAT C-terminal dimerisation domain-containing protein n=1 Tax=Rotaria magnacalcarata TaxID=392030 RepID=A0A815VLM9_9BILA|nr:unnamed protein product [Rotaria magnacalcarata]CAF1594426.1 unnamed protein product [Rotaria magnacalcarata]CAF4277894.1 unnamed protein product [Rotaria magnacalcarata]CAF4290807.1 unnamed protein product [Rotaria magnacalcarata]CAF4298314.1 unnamed protein product [Rotaria magnacalcarata]
MRAAFREQCVRVGCSIHFLNKQLEHSFTSLEIDKQPVRCPKVQHIFGHAKRIVTHVLESLAAIDKDLLEELCIFIKLFDQAINQLSDENKPTIHQVIPILQLLINHCEITLDDSDGLKDVKHFVAQVVTNAITINKPRLTTCDPSSSPPQTVSLEDLLGRCFDQPQLVVKVDNEVDDYMALDTFLNEKEDVLLFWKDHSNKFPMLSSIVQDLYAIPASNTVVE